MRVCGHEYIYAYEYVHTYIPAYIHIYMQLRAGVRIALLQSQALRKSESNEYSMHSNYGYSSRYYYYSQNRFNYIDQPKRPALTYRPETKYIPDKEKLFIILNSIMQYITE
jgi:hypothetical protein